MDTDTLNIILPVGQAAERLQDATRQIRQRKGPVYDAIKAEGLGNTIPDQIPFPFYLDEERLAVFLTQWSAIEDEEDRLREEKRLLKEQHIDDFPMRGVLTALKVVRAQRKLEAHPKEPMRRVHQGLLEAMIERHLMQQDLEREALARQAQTVPDMTG